MREIQVAVVRTLRYAALLTPAPDGERNLLLETADAVERVTDWNDCPCCPLCEESTCDTNCALAPLRAQGP